MEGTARPGAENRLRESAVLPAELHPHRAPGHLQGGGHPISPKLSMLYFLKLQQPDTVVQKVSGVT